MRALLIAGIALTCLDVHAADIRPFDGPNPVAVLVQTDPWAMVIGSDTPRVAVYEDGEIIFLKKTNGTFAYHHWKLLQAELTEFKNRLVPVGKLKDLKNFYDARPHFTDQPEAMFYLRTDQRELVTRVYGLTAPSTRLPAHTSFPGGSKPHGIPKELLELHRFLCSIDYADSEPWTPRYLEAMVWPYEYAREASIIWPSKWPGLESERAFRRGDSYSIFMDGNVLPNLREFLGTRKERGAVEIGGRKWMVSCRFTFPSEPVWRKAFGRAQRR